MFFFLTFWTILRLRSNLRYGNVCNRSAHQTGFVKDRYIGENIRLISDIMEQAKKLNCSGILLSLDFQKAFNTLEWPCISNVLKMCNFGE